MLKSGAVVLDFEGFRSKKSGFIIKELAVSTENYNDIISFLTPKSFNILCSSEQRSFLWVSKFLHGLSWETGEYPYHYLQQIFQSIVLRFPFSDFYAKGLEKTETLRQLLQRKVINLETLFCPKIEHLKLYRETPVCKLYTLSCPKRQRTKHCANKKAKLFYQWLTNESSVRETSSVSTTSEFVSKFDSLKLHNA